MLTLEKYKIEETESFNHHFTIELQFKNPITKQGAKNYIENILKKANETTAKTEKDICKEIFNAGKVKKEKMTIAEIISELEHVPQNSNLIVDGKFVTEVFTEESWNGNLCVGLITEDY